MSHRRAPRHAAARRPKRLHWRTPAVVEACVCGAPTAALDPQPTTTYGEALLGADGPWRPTSLGPLSSDFMAQRPRMTEVTRHPADVGAARVVSFQSSHTFPALAVDDPIRVKDGVRDFGGQYGTVFGFSCAADRSIGARLADGQLVYFAPDEVDPAPVSDTLVMDDLAGELLAMGGAR